jgi:hypothetical protein
MTTYILSTPDATETYDSLSDAHDVADVLDMRGVTYAIFADTEAGRVRIA